MSEYLAIVDSTEQTQEAEPILLATVGSVSEEGVTLIFAGEAAATAKRYKGNLGADIREGDTVKVTPDSGTWLIDYALGVPGSRRPIPAGGTDGQLLVKNGAIDYALKWADSASGLLPKGGMPGQVLKKYGAGDYAVAWSDVSAAKLESGAYSLTLSSGALTPSGNNSISIGTSTYQLKDLYAGGTVKLGDSYSGRVSICGSSAYLGFFGKTPVSKQTVSNSATVATLITALKAYGLIV